MIHSGITSLSGWRLSHPSENYELVSWDDEIPGMWVMKFPIYGKISMFQTSRQFMAWFYPPSSRPQPSGPGLCPCRHQCPCRWPGPCDAKNPALPLAMAGIFRWKNEFFVKKCGIQQEETAFLFVGWCHLSYNKKHSVFAKKMCLNHPSVPVLKGYQMDMMSCICMYVM